MLTERGLEEPIVALKGGLEGWAPQGYVAGRGYQDLSRSLPQ